MLDRFYLIVDQVEWIMRLLPVGVKLVQLRVKGLPDEEVRAQIEFARDICRDAGAQLIVNDYWQAAIDLGCDFVHLGQEDLDGADVAAIKAAGMRLGISTHDDAELERALAFDPDYIALGPIYPTILKKMKWEPQGLDKIGVWKKRIGDLPLVAIGGITVERASGVYDAGADSIAVVTDVLLAENPEDRVRAWLAC